MVFAQGLVGMVASAGQSWLDIRQPPKEELAAQLVNLIWNGLSGLQHSPRLISLERDRRAKALAEHAKPTTDATPETGDEAG